MSRRVRLTSWFAHRSQSPEEAAELKRMEADYHAANAAIARACVEINQCVGCTILH